MSKIDLGSHKVVRKIQEKFISLRNQHARKNFQSLMVENSIGNNLYNARECYRCFDSSDLEYCNYCTQVQFGARHCYDIYQFGIDIELCFDSAMIGYNIYNCYFCYDLLEQCSDLQYCISLQGSKDCFACFGIKKGQYCILNKQYSREDYFSLRAKLIDRMQADGSYGSFFPMSLSPHAYNETTAQGMVPKNKRRSN